jgi:hypothetical protein
MEKRLLYILVYIYRYSICQLFLLFEDLLVHHMHIYSVATISFRYPPPLPPSLIRHQISPMML